MQTYLTERLANDRYSVKVVRHDGVATASGNFPDLRTDHKWVDMQRKESAEIGVVIPPGVFTRQ